MGSAINWRDTFHPSEQRTIFTEAELEIPGLRTLGWQNARTAAPALPEHFHQDAVEITFTTNTVLTFGIGGTSYEIHGGDAFFTRPDQVHSTNEAPISQGEIFWIQLDVRDPRRFLFLDAAAGADLLERLLALPGGVIHTDNRFCTRLVREILRQTVEDAAGYTPQRIAAYLVVYLHTLLQWARTASPGVTPDIAAACAYIAGHLRQPLSLEQLAAVSRLSLSQFKRKFQQQMGIPPGRYIAQQKIQAVKPLLRPGCSCTELAMAFGFCDSSYFAAVFRKFTGMTPTAYMARQASEAGTAAKSPEISAKSLHIGGGCSIMDDT